MRSSLYTTVYAAPSFRQGLPDPLERVANPEAMDGNVEADNKPCYVELLSEIKHSHPCALDPGNPCRDDVLCSICV
ncbi:MAG: hypothetical protein ACXV8O_21640 [Methylobacter sp.]